MEFNSVSLSLVIILDKVRTKAYLEDIGTSTTPVDIVSFVANENIIVGTSIEIIIMNPSN